MSIFASNNKPLTHDDLVEAYRSLQYPQYPSFKRQVMEVPTDIERIFRLKQYIDNSNNTPDARSIAKLLLEDITDA